MSIIGYDYLGRAIRKGDTIMDDDCRRYPIDDWGRPVTEGGQVRNLADLRDVIVLEKVAPPSLPKKRTRHAKYATEEERKAALREAHERWRVKNREKVNAGQRARTARRTDEQKARDAARNKAYRDTHREQTRARQKRYIADHREAYLAYHKNYYRTVTKPKNEAK